MAPAANPAPAPAQRSRVGARSLRIHRKEKKSGAEMNAIRNGHTAKVVPRSKWMRLCEAAEDRLVAPRIHIMSTTKAIPVGNRPSRVLGRPKRATQRTASTPKHEQYSSRTQNANSDTS